MTNKDYIAENKHSDDPFVQDLFTELDHRITELENENEYVEPMKLADALVPTIVTGLIAVLLLFTLF